MPERQDNWRDRVFVRGLNDHMPGVKVLYVPPGQVLCLDEVHIEALTPEDLVLRAVEWARPKEPTLVSYRSVLYHSGAYHVFLGARQ